GQFGLPEGTVASRLARARAMLANRLARHGVAVGSLVSVAQRGSADVPMPLVDSTVKCAILSLSGQSTAVGSIPPQVVTLTQGVLKSMFFAKLRFVTTTLLTTAVLSVAVGLAANAVFAKVHTEPGQQAKPNNPESPVAKPIAIAASSLG